MYIETKKKMTGERENGALNYSQRTTSQPTEPDALDQLMDTRTKQLFAASAYWGAAGVVPPREPDDVVKDNLFPFKNEINRKLMPLPREVTSFPKTLDYTHIGLHLMTDTGNSTGGLNKAQQDKLSDGDSGMVVGPDGKMKPRFLNLQTEYMRMPHKFDPAVLDEAKDGEDKEKQYEADRKAKGSQAFESADPDPYRLTSDDYCDFGGVDPSSYRVEGDWDKESGLPLGDRTYLYKSRWNNVNREGPKRRQHTHDVLQKEHEVDPDELRQIMLKERGKHMPRGYKPFSAKEWLSTTHREHAGYDIDKAADANHPDSTDPLRNINYRLTPAHQQAVEYHDERQRTKLDGEYGTEYGDNYLDRHDEADVTKDHSGKSVFDIQYGVYTMDHHFHHPRSDVKTGERYKPHELVPQQYVSMATEPLMAKNEIPSRLRKV